jgi:hypothetical protein
LERRNDAGREGIDRVSTVLDEAYDCKDGEEVSKVLTRGSRSVLESKTV